jgi:hypothetical protein
MSHVACRTSAFSLLSFFLSAFLLSPLSAPLASKGTADARASRAIAHVAAHVSPAHPGRLEERWSTVETRRRVVAS